MNLDRLSEYLGNVERRLRALALWRGAALVAGCALAGTVLAVLASNSFAFSEGSVTVSRVALFVTLALALGAGLLLPVLRLNRRRTAREIEGRFPQFQERLLTLTERMDADPRDPFLELLAGDSLEAARHARPEEMAGRGRLLGFASASAASFGVLIWLGVAGPGFLGYGTSLLWGGPPRGEQRPFYDIHVQPGDRTIRKRADQLVLARLIGFRSQHVKLMARYASSSKWEEAEMQAEPGGPSYQFLFAGVPESLEYYVEAGGVRSRRYKLDVIDLPSVKRVRVTYRFPSWTGMKDEVEDPGGDLRAIEGTQAEVAFETDRPLTNGALLLDDGTKLSLRAGPGNWRLATVPIQKDGLYYVAVAEAGTDVRLTEDYFIEARKDQQPTVRIARPGRDARVSPIEEVPVAVEAADDFGLQEVSLRYSVNGGPERSVGMMRARGEKTANGNTLLYLEDFKLQPGDVVSLYATARDARAEARTDMFFIEAQPFEREYTQSQQMGGGGGGGGEDGNNRISQRQKEIIAATWNQIRDKSGDKAQAAENAKFLADMQAKLRDQAKSLANRMRARQLAGASGETKSFVEDMEKAAEAMTPASDKLRAGQWQPALQPEQKALQHLLRAEATFRNIQVAFGNRGGGGGGGGGMGRELDSLFDLELDTEKNQYETGQQNASGDQRQREIDEALQKLEQLARRQQELAEQQRRQQQLSQQRWQQEMLRREAEQLQRQMQQLSRGGGQPSSSGGQQSAQGQQLQRAAERLEQALRDMRQAQSGSSQAEARRAAERLQEARNALSGMRQQQAGEQADRMAREAERLSQQQQDFGNRMRQAFGQQLAQGARPGMTREQAEQMAQEKEQMMRDLQRLEGEMQRAVREMAPAERKAASRMREALGQLQQEELPSRMRWTAEALRRGLGAYATMREATTTQALQELRDRLRDVQSQLGQGQEAGRQQQGLEQALAQAERLREQMQQMARGRQQQGAGGREPGAGGQQQQGGGGREPGAGGREQQGGGGREPGPGGRELGPRGGPAGGGPGGGSYSAMNRGDWQPPDPGNVQAAERDWRETLRQLGQLQRAVEGHGELQRDVQDLLRDMQRLDPRRFPGNPAMVERLHDEVLREIEGVEMQLRRLLDQQGSSVRTGAGRPVPPGYANAVAEYFRKLSKQ